MLPSGGKKSCFDCIVDLLPVKVLKDFKTENNQATLRLKSHFEESHIKYQRLYGALVSRACKQQKLCIDL